LNRYKVDLVFNSNNIDLLRHIEPYFDKVYTDIKYNQIIEDYNNHQFPANKLFNFTEKQWKRNRKYYNEHNIDDKFYNTTAVKYDVLVSSNQIPDNEFLQICYNIHPLINEYGVGEYNYGNTNIKIKNKVLNNPLNKVENPIFDNNLLEIK